MDKIVTFQQISTLHQRFDLLKFLQGTTKYLNMIYGVSNQQKLLYRPLLGTNGVIILSENPNNTERFLTMLLYQYFLYNISTQTEVMLVIKEGHSTKLTELVKEYPQLRIITATTENIYQIQTFVEETTVTPVVPKLIIFHELVKTIVDVDLTTDNENYDLTQQLQDLFILTRMKGLVPIITGSYQGSIFEYKEGFVYNTDRIYLSNTLSQQTVPFQLVRKSSPVLDEETYTMLSISQRVPIYLEELHQLNSILLTNQCYLEKKKDLQ